MIISASRRTDILAFYSEWFIRRIQEGYFISINPFNPNQRKQVSLLPDDVDAIVFWSKNPKPLEPDFSYLDKRGYRYYIQFTLNHYPCLFEANLPSLKERISTFQRISERIGPGRLIWRYDPIIISNISSLEYHLETFCQLADQLKGFTHRVIISLVDFYGKVETRLKKIPDLILTDIRKVEYQESLAKLMNGLADAAGKNNIKIFSCAEQGLEEYGINRGSCIDVELLNQLFNLNLNVKRDSSQRPGCLCASSVDVGIYGTCKFGCSYCYANRDARIVNNYIMKHNPKSPILIG